MTGQPIEQDEILASLIARCPEHGHANETWPECRCDAARKTAALMATAAAGPVTPEPTQPATNTPEEPTP